jgi:sugar phosphate isomerase/epimerase
MILPGGPVFVKSDDPEVLARAHADLGYAAAFCPPLKAGETDRIRAVREAFARQGIVIAEVGAWCNMIAPEEEKRRKNLAYVTERLALAEEVGARCCVDYAGTLEPGKDWSAAAANFSKDAFDLIVQTVRDLLAAVKPTRTQFTLEVMQTCPPDGVDSYLELIRAIDRPAFGVHLDPANMFYSPRQLFDGGATLRDGVRRLGPWIASCHAKDLTIRPGLALHVDECIPGTGLLDYRVYVSELASLDRDVPLMLEHLRSEAEYRQAAEFVSGLIAGR